jgi:hypothetical protein
MYFESDVDINSSVSASGFGHIFAKSILWRYFVHSCKMKALPFDLKRALKLISYHSFTTIKAGIRVTFM